MRSIEVVTIKQCLSLCCAMDYVALQTTQVIHFHVPAKDCLYLFVQACKPAYQFE